jgi:hypothetical protein
MIAKPIKHGSSDAVMSSASQSYPSFEPGLDYAQYSRPWSSEIHPPARI